MDPLLVFPPEIAHKIWNYLSPQDLLQARAVSIDWLASITSCPDAWVTDLSSDWHEFLEVKKTLRRWSSNHVRQEEIRNVREFAFTEIAYYLLFGDGQLRMYSPNGNLVRSFDGSASDLHVGNKSLLVGVDRPNPHSVNTRTSRHETLVLDYVLNVIDIMSDVCVVDSSPYGFSCYINDELYFEIDHVKHRAPFEMRLNILENCAVAVKGLTVKTIQYFDSNSTRFQELKSVSSSPRWIPSIEILPGPSNFFCAIVEQRDFSKISVYSEGLCLLQNSFDDSFKCFFTENYFVQHFRDELTVYSLNDFQMKFIAEVPIHFKLQRVISESWSLLKNCYATFSLYKSDSFNGVAINFWTIRNSFVKKLTSVHHDDQNRSNSVDISSFKFLSSFAFKYTVLKTGAQSGSNQILSILHFDI